MTINRQAVKLFGQVVTTILCVCSAASYAQICSTNANLNIPDGSGSAGAGTPASITIDVPAFFTNAITDLTFDLRIDHTWVGDLIVTLQSPSGTTVTLMDRPGRPASTFGCGLDNVDANFDDASGTPVENECAGGGTAIQGTLNPQGSLSDFDGEIPAGVWTLTVTDNAGFDTGTIISTANCLDLTTVPVVLSSFRSGQFGKRLITNWQTSSEAFNLGFNVWGKVNDEWLQLNNRLIRSGAVDSVEPLNYRRGFKTNRLASPPTEIGISSLSSSGFEEFYGPFQIGEEYGEISVPKPIDWNLQRQQHTQRMVSAGYEWRKGRWRKSNPYSSARAKKLKKRFPDVWLRTEEAGVYRVTYEQLLTHGVNLKGVPIRMLAMSQSGGPLNIRVKGSTRRPWRFGPGAEIVFFAAPPSGELARYVQYNNVRLSVDRSLAARAPYVHQLETESTAADFTHIKTVKFGEPKGYSFIIPGENPWYDEVVFAFGNTASKTLTFDVAESALLEKNVSVSLNLMGGTSFDNVDADGDGEVEPDHHFKVYLNRTLFPTPIYEGYSEMVDPVSITASIAGQLLSGTNTLELEVIPDNGHNIDAAYFLNGSLSYVAQHESATEQQMFAVDDDQETLKVKDSTKQIERAFLYDSAGNFSQLKARRDQATISVSIPPAIGESKRRTVWFSNGHNFLSPSDITHAPLVPPENLDLQQTDYVVIADPSLINEDLDRFVSMHTELGRSVSVINSYDIYAEYADGLPVPHAIAEFLRQAALGNPNSEPSPFQHVLLVGGHTYNYLGFNSSEDEQPINLIPSFYRNGQQTINRQIPTAVPFVDFDSNGSPDRAIGRWPVRDTMQLKYVVDKTLAWHREGSNKNNQQALLIAQKDEDLNKFSDSLERVNTSIGNNTNPWQTPLKVYVSDILSDDTIPADSKIATARNRLVSGINQGPALTVYSGHASPTSWGRENLLTTSVVERFTNSDSPTLIMPLACYTTYYETPKVKSLAESLFADNPAGAVGLSGPALLSYSAENERFARDVSRLMTQQGLDLGSAVLKAKQRLENAGARKQTVIYNWVTLADPSLSFNLPIVNEAPKHQKTDKKPR